MRCMVLALALAAAAGLLGTAPAAGQELPQRRLTIRCDVYEMRADRGKTLVGRPQMQTLEGLPVSFESGSPLLVEIEKGRKIEVRTGVRCQVDAYCLASGKLKLDLDLDFTQPVADRREGDGAVTRKSGVRVVRTIAWGERVVVPLSNDAGEATHVVECVVTEQAPLPHADVDADEVPPPPGARRK